MYQNGQSTYPSPYPPGPPAPPPPRPRRRVLKVLLGIFGGGMLLLVALVLLGSVVGKSAPAPTRNAVDGATEKAGRLSAIDLRPGDCYNAGQLPPEPGSTQFISTVEVVPCTTPHTDQVIDKISYRVADDLDAVRDRRAGADCDKAYAAKLSAAAAKDATVQRGLILPRDAATWARHPVVACTVSHPSRSTSVLG
ncbi:hypothetical protein ACQEVB_20660 [Pseudonocardia sp. CA-107938]|uniref:hypothetical protein n=1 Tax=Pseudonocardia sp. CA-107938 TaxID=3240021 RepID=UPI003D8C9578